jgi:hypothetical protein
MNWESPQAAQPAGNHLSRYFHFRGDYSLDADYSLNYFLWNEPGAYVFDGDGFGLGQPLPFMHMFEARTGLFQVCSSSSTPFQFEFARCSCFSLTVCFQPPVPFEQRYSDTAVDPALNASAASALGLSFPLFLSFSPQMCLCCSLFWLDLSIRRFPAHTFTSNIRT